MVSNVTICSTKCALSDMKFFICTKYIVILF